MKKSCLFFVLNFIIISNLFTADSVKKFRLILKFPKLTMKSVKGGDAKALQGVKLSLVIPNLEKSTRQVIFLGEAPKGAKVVGHYNETTPPSPIIEQEVWVDSEIATQSFELLKMGTPMEFMIEIGPAMIEKLKQNEDKNIKISFTTPNQEADLELVSLMPSLIVPIKEFLAGKTLKKGISISYKAKETINPAITIDAKGGSLLSEWVSKE